MDPKIASIAQQIMDNVESALKQAGKDFLISHADVKDFLESKAKRAADLAVQYITSEDSGRPAIKANMDIVYESILNTVITVALDAAADARATLTGIVSSAFSFILKNLPTIIALVKQ